MLDKARLFAIDVVDRVDLVARAISWCLHRIPTHLLDKDPNVVFSAISLPPVPVRIFSRIRVRLPVGQVAGYSLHDEAGAERYQARELI
jgi:hypothetical protein